ncbi:MULTISPECIES: bifunctional riboflavin kinase/FAD synthetase [Clostridium]|jgi:riboflavin kinase/FMN adenylyltransferase|uniref:bifunctional riboflavin kinase/FAD synthetase n=1 Tax=Clostridium TaxID=1485 RepID=UPI000DCFCE20|nr:MULTISPECIES: bifunctional riboflavin kinase/FAD synthetase [Clostridium]MBS5883469.1 bifunctional riboflavin kinase/FAD synthetase [Clostridium sp.]MBU6135674.1 bifunctional riboflavin kinase/FAD synthetase [Clostridium tertium]MDB1968208.1 bifunctional riboflavin kinase/FAD synthetase [Clostridium tertium]MDU1565827.1 bifunctional riboflavin kinase/FAD synthetase [Clostridium sp.]MDU2681191.1 bifunctional riboflavin kinase/FAD synthetase [Clostridium sp.]
MIVIDDIIMDNKDSENYVALGSFDGLHSGHLSLVKKTVQVAKEKNGKSMVFTYKNHPKTLVKPESAPKLIMDLETKLKYLEEENVDIVVLRSFTKEFMSVSAEDFIKLLCVDYNVKGIIVGFNFRFGYKNLGDVKLLEDLQGKYGYKLYVMEPYTYNGDVISSTRIRKSILEGDVKEASKMLSKPYLIKGKVIHGKKLGRTIGFPTANLEFDSKIIIPDKGVYYTNVEYNNKTYKGITSVGYNPTVNGQQLTIETYILDFDDTIYGQELKVYFIERIREEIKFNSLDELVEQIKKDENFAKDREIVI